MWSVYNEDAAFRQFLIISPDPYCLLMQLLGNLVFIEFPCFFVDNYSVNGNTFVA